MTAADLIADPGFLGFCAAWERDGRCPAIFADWLLDHDLPGAADAAGWAATEPDRYGEGGMGGVRPHRPDVRKAWCWFPQLPEYGPHFQRSHIPSDVWAAGRGRLRKGSTRWKEHPSFADAVAVGLLLAWAAARVPA